MQNRLLVAALAAVLVAASAPALAQSAPKPYIMMTGGTTGTYFQLGKEMHAACGTEHPFESKVSESGTLGNIEYILTNQAEMGIVQHDGLELLARKNKDVKDRIFTLLPLHPEEIHFITKAAPRKEGGLMGVGATEVTLNNVTDLKKRKVGAWGGGIVTSQIVNTIALIGWESVELKSADEAIAALNGGHIDAILAVGGQPLGWVQKLNRDYKLLEVPDQIAKMLDAVYSRATVSYRNLGQEGVPTISVDALLVTRNYTSASHVKRLVDLRNCVASKIDEIRDERGTHPKWQVIDPTRGAKWQMFPPEKPKS